VIGRPAVSIAWGLWEEDSAMTGRLGGTELARIARSGIAPLTTTRGLELFDAALGLGEAVTVAAGIETAAPHRRPAAAALPPMLRGLTRLSAPPPVQTGPTLPPQLGGLTEEERVSALLRLVNTQTALVLGHSESRTLDDDRGFSQVGLDSLSAIELRNRLTAATGLTLHATVAFDHPTPRALAHHLHTRLPWTGPDVAPPGDDGESALRDPVTAAASSDAIDQMDVSSLVRLALADEATPAEDVENR
jgi:aryl carrier-like protein